MGDENHRKLNRLQKELPEGLLVDAAWLETRGYYGSLRKKYVESGWLEQPTHRVYRRPRGSTSWEQAVISLQALLELPLVVGGRTALELQGFAHYLKRQQTEIHLYGRRPPPSWLRKLPPPGRFVFHRSSRLFRSDAVAQGMTSLGWTTKKGRRVSAHSSQNGVTIQPWGDWGWPLTLSTPERALLELIDELPRHETFHQVDKLMEGLVSLRPRRLQELLEDCRSVKVKRLFFFLADRHGYAWLKQIERRRIDFGRGKRMLVRGGRLAPAYGITVPRDLDGLQ